MTTKYPKISESPPRKRGRPRKASPLPPSQLRRTLNRAGVGEAVGGSLQKTYDLQAKDPDFPEPFYVGSTPLWYEDEIAAYLQRKADARPSSVRALLPSVSNPA
ncbi:hypothetical protein PUN4_770059 [Paraburkholderia unamae]|uniref:hypothetical protein n=1 Tax=Paraburkholderia unamae TaxID=219649 RepID=UPI001CAB2CCA|nr:hypothetical protein [Paraburkholderia unamae]CAG9273334.1 hypothetical protein PUN4_770059 [Paraburkholderia unamae]